MKRASEILSEHGKKWDPKQMAGAPRYSPLVQWYWLQSYKKFSGSLRSSTIALTDIASLGRTLIPGHFKFKLALYCLTLHLQVTGRPNASESPRSTKPAADQQEMEFYNFKKEYVDGLDLVYSVSVYPAISLIAFYYTHYHVFGHSWTFTTLELER